MNAFKLIFILILLIMFSCETYKPFESRKDKLYFENLITEKYNIPDSKVEKSDRFSLFEISASLKDSIDSGLISRRLDSFKIGTYSNKELQLILKLDRMLAERGWNVEFSKNSNLGYKKITSLEGLNNFIKKIDSSMNYIHMEAKVDTIGLNDK